MKTNLTLRISANAIAIARKYATEKGSSLSQLVENYFNALSESSKRRVSAKNLVGMMGTVPKNFDYKKELMSILHEKYKV